MNLLKLDRWKLFLLISPVPIIILFSITSSIVPALENVLEFFVYANMIFLHIWYYQIGIQLQKNNPPAKTTRFKLAFLIIVSLFIYAFSNQFYHEYILNEDPYAWMHNESRTAFWLRFIISTALGFPSYIYFFYVIIKILLSLKNPTWAFNNVQTTLLLLYSPVFGALLLQPRINLYVRSKKTTT